MAKLNYRQYGQGEPLIIMHGLYGASDNWVSVARSLMNDFAVYILDMRNHGASPHSDVHNYAVMADDLLEFMNDKDIYQANIMGHSMGGKVAMTFTALQPERVKKLIVVDISPRSYSFVKGDNQVTDHQQILGALKAVPIDEVKSRKEVDDRIANGIPSQRIRQFLLKNLVRDPKKGFNWKLNIDVLYHSLENVLIGLEGERDELLEYKNDVLFIRGGESDYIVDVDVEMIKDTFLNPKIITIEGASHWVHAEKPVEFMVELKRFLLL